MVRRTERKRQHSPGFKVECVRLMRERLAAGNTLQRVSEELEIGPDLLRVWAREVDGAAPAATPEEIFPGSGRKRRPEAVRKVAMANPPVSKDEELARLRRENERLRQERDFLKKATAFFAKESQ